MLHSGSITGAPAIQRKTLRMIDQKHHSLSALNQWPDRRLRPCGQTFPLPPSRSDQVLLHSGLIMGAAAIQRMPMTTEMLEQIPTKETPLDGSGQYSRGLSFPYPVSLFALDGQRQAFTCSLFAASPALKRLLSCDIST